MTLDDVMSQERRALVAEYLFEEGLSRVQVPPYCAVPDFDVLKKTPSNLRARHPVSIEELPGKKTAYAFVQSCASLGYEFLWVHADNDDYRADYITFLQRRHGMAVQSLPQTHHVDHLYNRARAKDMGLSFIRAVLLPKSINTSHGAGYERARTHSGIGRPGRERGVDEIVLMKLCGIQSPRKNMPLTPEMRAYVQQIAVLFGVPAAEVERNIRELMQVASFKPGS